MSESRRGGLLGLVDELRSLRNTNRRAVLGIVFATSGSTYQKPGALVLLDENGLRYGVISGGCLEPELEERAQQVLRDERASTIDFDMRTDEDVTFGSGTGCRGRVRLLLLPIRGDAPISLALCSLADGQRALSVQLKTHGDDVGAGSASLSGSTWNWGNDGRAREEFSSNDAVVALHVAAPPRLLLLGAGPECIALQEFARRLGWRTCVVEHRGRWLNFAKRANVDDIIEQSPEQASSAWIAWGADAVIAMSHNFSVDLKNLALCASTNIGYIGLLGPAARRDELLRELSADVVGKLRDRLHAPVGLALGGSGPDVLALSIVSELQQFFARTSAQGA